ncbi:hypothetical protein DFA_01144 [Cavenderia fasciculata]|uniref:SRR1-like domain-containing protein n=1 Tax=Cavenderia fasciculata TaxID=261658 RepID=F4PR00_CACFS|nr:uncharacterized protein DFA_01144 [Cavenderia fasciculata]EGG21265.1 hypothetical protein DFA_01144 [Cavenderia fasciculata]|eukprot:XP_004359115.1 hypothetical protein DFA_01144 [Cavenderia fasciculata]
MDKDGFVLIVKGRKNKAFKGDEKKDLKPSQLQSANDIKRDNQLREKELSKRVNMSSNWGDDDDDNNEKKKKITTTKNRKNNKLFTEVSKRRKIETMKNTEFFKEIIENEKIKSMLQDRLEDIVCYGIGNFEESKKCQEQLSFILALNSLFKISGSLFIYDPVMSDMEINVSTLLGFKIIETNEQCKRSVKCQPDCESQRSTLFYMPFCPRKLYDNVLWANWSPQSLGRLIVIGNSWNLYNESLNKPDESYLQYSYTTKAYQNKLYQEISLPNNYPTKFIFHDLSFHSFELSNQITDDLDLIWKDFNEPPTISNDSEVQ